MQKVRSLFFSLTTLGIAGFTIVASAQAQVIDAANDFLSTYTAGAKNPDLDVLQTNVTLLPNSTFSFTGTLAGNIGTTPGALYVFGLDRGQGTARFNQGTTPIGPKVLFDAVVILRPDGTGAVNDFINNVQTNLAAGSLTISGASFTGSVPLNLLPSTGRPADQYTFDFWPRVGLGNNNQVADFAPDSNNARISVAAAPEPGSVALLTFPAFLSLGILTIKRTKAANRARCIAPTNEEGNTE
ncbi:MAG: hypothetical protein V4671_19045 [Armatimonadota bacterium]